MHETSYYNVSFFEVLSFLVSVIAFFSLIEGPREIDEQEASGAVWNK
jgi:hypothetical protein